MGVRIAPGATAALAFTFCFFRMHHGHGHLNLIWCFWIPLSFVAMDRWAERPLATVVLKQGASATPDELREFLAPKVARCWLPERWAFVDELPKTSVGKLDKKVIRADYAAGKYAVEESAGASRRRSRHWSWRFGWRERRPLRASPAANR